jgi:hypothetical protein
MLQLPRNRQFDHRLSYLSRARLNCANLKEIALALERQLRAKLKLRKSRETSLLSRDHIFRIPPCQPYVDPNWGTQVSRVWLTHRCMWSDQAFSDFSALFFRHLALLQENDFSHSLYIEWPNSISLNFYYGHRYPKGIFELAFTQVYPNDQAAILRTRAIADVWGGIGSTCLCQQHTMAR